MRTDFCKYTEIGGRMNNEDSIGIFAQQTGTLFVVADGLGGHDRGEVASRLAVSTLHEQISGPLSGSTIRAALEEANRKICEAAENGNMMTTIAALWLDEHLAYAATAGDSRIYQFRDGSIQFQSVDHSLAQLDMLAGDTRYADVRDNPDRNKLVRAAGIRNGFRADINLLECRKGDAFLLCSDGFWEKILEAEMLECLKRAEHAEQWLTEMRGILKCRLNEDSDNHSAITVILN